ncbi:hypothetical protein [Streptomyces hydrogenans]|uniref:hypothetical protein n=1 Tax=Streptomyces hydrogenans TaxID=1873719 RepID=UPI0036E7CAD7
MARRDNANSAQDFTWPADVPAVDPEKSLARPIVASDRWRKTRRSQRQTRADLRAQMKAAQTRLRSQRLTPEDQPNKIKLVFRSQGRKYTLTVDVAAADTPAARQRFRDQKIAELERLAEDARLDASLRHFDEPMPSDVVRALVKYIKADAPAPPLRPRRR